MSRCKRVGQVQSEWLFWVLVHMGTAFLHMIVHVVGGREPDGLVSRSADAGKGHESLSLDFSTVKI